FRNRQLPCGRLVLDFGSHFHDVVRQNLPAILQNNFVRPRRRHRHQQQRQGATDFYPAPLSHPFILSLSHRLSSGGLLLNAECDYTRVMRFRPALVVFLLLVLLLSSARQATTSVSPAASPSARETLAALNALQLD